MNRTKDSDNPALALFIADPEMVEFLREFQQRLFQHRDKLANISTPALSVDGILELRSTIASIFPDREIVTLFRPARVQALRLSLESTKSRFSVDDLLFFQLAIILMRLASDYISACDLFESHKEGITRAYPRVLAFNPITNAVSWDKVRSQMQEVLGTC
jgi:hypothetical protein